MHTMKLQYTQSHKKSVTTDSFSEHHEIGVSTNIKMYLAVDFMSYLSSHRLESIYPNKLNFQSSFDTELD